MRSIFFVYRYGDHRVLPLLTHSFPTRRASDLPDGGPETAPQACACRHPYLVLLPVGFAVPLPLPVARCALTAPFHPYHEAANPKTGRSEEHTSELQSLMRISYAVFCLKKKQQSVTDNNNIANRIDQTHT